MLIFWRVAHKLTHKPREFDEPHRPIRSMRFALVFFLHSVNYYPHPLDYAHPHRPSPSLSFFVLWFENVPVIYPYSILLVFLSFFFNQLSLSLTFSIMSELVARTGRHQQRYDQGFRLVAGYVFVIWVCNVAI